MIQQSHKKRFQNGIPAVKTWYNGGEIQSAVRDFLGGSEVWAQSYRTAGIKAGEGNGGELSPEASGKAQRGGRPLTCVPPQWEESQQGTGREVLLENRIGGAGAPSPY